MAKDKRGGHNRKSEEQHLQDKNWRPDRHGLPNAFVPGEPVPQMPLGEHGRALWSEVLANLPSAAISKADGFKLSMLCSQWDQLQVQMAIWTADPANGNARAAVNQLSSSIDRLGAQFGLSPKDRQRMPRAGWDKSAQEQDLFAEFMKAGQN